MVRPYTKDSLIQRGTTTKEPVQAQGPDDDADGGDWEGDSVPRKNTVSINDAVAAEEAEDAEELEE